MVKIARPSEYGIQQTKSPEKAEHTFCRIVQNFRDDFLVLFIMRSERISDLGRHAQANVVEQWTIHYTANYIKEFVPFFVAQAENGPFKISPPSGAQLEF